jgi:hypothetical protein
MFQKEDIDRVEDYGKYNCPGNWIKKRIYYLIGQIAKKEH